jgi:N-methylhydantoinase A
VRRTAAGIIEVVNAAMVRALRVISVERGHDPRAFTLVAFGGAAALHACELASQLDMRDVLIPAHPGVLSAAGMAAAPAAREYVTTVRRVDPSYAELVRLEEPWRRRGVGALVAERVPRRTIVAGTFARMRYLGQAHELEVALAPDFRARFDDTHERMYGHATAGRAVEVLALRVEVTGARAVDRRPPSTPPARRAPSGAPHTAVWRGRPIRMPRYERDALVPGTRFAGPALVVEYSSTIFVPPGWRARVDGDRHLHLARPVQ